MSRKHSNDRLDFQWAFGLNRLSLNLIGIWPSNVSHEVLIRDGTSSDFRQIRAPSMMIWMLVGLVAPQLYALTYVRGELALVVDNLTTSCTTLTSSIKLFVLWNSRHLLRPIVERAMSDWSEAASRSEHELMVKQARRARMFTISGYVIMLFCLLGFVATPFFGLSTRIINNLTDPAGPRRFFPVQTRYPFDALRSPNFQLVYATQIIAASFVGISFSVTDNFFGALVFHASAQCEILEAKLRALVASDDPKCIDYQPGQLDNNFRAKLRQIVQLHVRLIQFVELLESSFNLLILTQVVCLSIIMCCLGFGIITSSAGHESESPPITQIITLGSTLLNLMIHMLVYCIASEILAQHGSALSDAVYSSNWYLLPPECSRDIVPIMTRAQLPLELTAGKFFNLSLSVYLGIMKTAAGYVSMLLTVSN